MSCKVSFKCAVSFIKIVVSLLLSLNFQALMGREPMSSVFIVLTLIFQDFVLLLFIVMIISNGINGHSILFSSWLFSYMHLVHVLNNGSLNDICNVYSSLESFSN